jgi:serine/threonine protein phosphatase 1
MVLGLFRSRRPSVIPPLRAPARVPDETTVYAVGDIHGRADLLERLHERILADAAARASRRRVVVYLGDYVDRGDASRRVVDIMLDSPLAGFEHVHLIGNHDAWLLHFLDDTEAGPGWFANGGFETLGSYGVALSDQGSAAERLVVLQQRLAERLPGDHRDFFESLRLYHTEGDYAFVHAGFRPGVPIERQVAGDMLWIRDDFLYADFDFGKVVVHGHTVTHEPEVTPTRIGIDTGAFATGRLTCLVLEGEGRDFLVA